MNPPRTVRVCFFRWLLVLPLIPCSIGLAADLTFFSLSDPHFGAASGRTNPAPIVRHPQVDVINSLPGTPYPDAIGGVVGTPRGILMQGDLINDGAVADKYATQWASFAADFGVNGEGRCRFPVFEGVGNHDLNPNRFVWNRVKERNLVRRQLGLISRVSSNGYHYSWDWDGVHFVQLNLFPGNVWPGEADAYGAVHDPLYARDFLREDLEQQVGHSGRPVVVIQHYRPIDENWWTYSAADKFHRVLQDYNIIALIVGHQGGGVSNTWRGYHWMSSNGELVVFRVTPENEFIAVTRRSSAWGVPFRKRIFFSYAASGLPAVVNNGNWASDITDSSATVSGKIVHEAASPTGVTVFWGTNDGGDNASAWADSRSLGIQPAGTLFSTRITGLRPWTAYFYRCWVTNRQGGAWAAASIPFTTRGVLPPGWQTTFIGYEQRPGGGANYADGTFTVRGSGRDIGERGQPIDNFQYAYQRLEGDGAITARIATMEVKSREPKVGVMLRETLDDDARNVALLFNPKIGVRLSARGAAVGDSATNAPVVPVKEIPLWVRLVRSANNLTGYTSPDGNNWTPVGPAVTIDLPASIYAGLAVTAGNRDESKLHTSTFDHVAIKGKTANE